MNILKRVALALAMLVSALPATVQAEEVAESLVFLKRVAVKSKKLMIPSVFGISSARTMGAYNGFLAGAAATSARSEQGGKVELDASAAAGFGLGNPQENLGVDTYLGIVSVNPDGSDGGFGVGEDGNLGFKVGRTFVTDEYDSISLAVGVNNLVSWGAAERINKNVYGVASLGSALEIGSDIVPVSVSVGAGSRQKDNEEFGVFAGLGVQVSEIVDMSAAFNSSRWMMGMTFKLNRLERSLLRNFVVQVGVDDLFNNDQNRRGVLVVAVPFSL